MLSFMFYKHYFYVNPHLILIAIYENIYLSHGDTEAQTRERIFKNDIARDQCKSDYLSGL